MPLPCPFLSQLSASELTKILAQHSQAQVVWLNNQCNKKNNHQIIGVFPKLSWTAYPTNKADNFLIVKSSNTTHIKTKQSYQQWCDELVAYCLTQQTQEKTCQTNTGLNIYKNGLMGFIGYDMSAHALSHQVTVKPDQPCAYLGHYDVYLKCDHHSGKYHWYLTTDLQNNDTKLKQVFKWLSQIKVNQKSIAPPSLSVQPIWQLTNYQQAFAKTQNYLYAGDSYQINLTQCWQGNLQHTLNKTDKLVDYLPALHRQTNAPFAGYLHITGFGSFSDFELVSCSPELFFTFEKTANQHRIITKPIKGTRPRGVGKQNDEQLKNELANSEKDLAENVMIVDLLRNDLGKYAKTGSVKVPKRFAIETFSNVHHMVSTITATLRDDTHPMEVLFGSLPAGSITGTPKKRAVEIIHELEAQNTGVERGAYCGTLGFINFDGTGQWNVLIRSLQACDNVVSLWAGGGITVASNCKAEYQECFDKVDNIIKVLAKPAKF